MRRALAVLTLLTCASASAAAGEKSDEQVAKDLKGCAPSTYEVALDCLDKFLPAASKSALAAPDGTIEAHFGLGMWMRNNWELWRQGSLYRSMQAYGIDHPDEMSGAILEGFAARQRGEPFDVAIRAAENRESAKRKWQQGVKEGRAGSIVCPKSPEPKNDKQAVASMEACFDHVAKTLGSGQE